MTSNANLLDLEEGQGGKHITDSFEFNNPVATADLSIRRAFLRKVYSLVFIQLFFTTVISAVCYTVEPINHGLKEHPAILGSSTFVSFILLFALFVKRRDVPINFLLLTGFTICISMSVGFTVSLYQASSVIGALVCTAIVVATLTLLTLQSKFDWFASHRNLIYVLLGLLITGIIISIFLPFGSNADKLMGGFFAVLFSAFIIFDTYQLMHRVSPEDYIIATIDIYLDIINLFLSLLRAFGERN